MKIVHIESGRHLYGGARQVEYLLGGLARRGVDTVLICPPGHRLGARPDLGRVCELPMHGDLDFGMTGRLRRVLARERADIVHVHSRRGADFFGGRAARAAGCRAVLTRRVQSAEPAPWARLKYGPYARVVAISRAVRAELCDGAGLDPARVVTIPSTVDNTLYAPDPSARSRLLGELGLKADAVVVGVAAQLIARKGHLFLFEALVELARRHPSLRVICVGRGPSARTLERRIAAHGLGACVRLAGFRADWPALLPGLDLLAHTPEREGLGVAVLEAMSAGVPVVATAVGGIPDAVTDGVEGLLVPTGDTRALAAALERLVVAGDERRRLGRAGRIRACAEFSVDAMVDRYLEVYRDVCAES